MLAPCVACTAHSACTLGKPCRARQRPAIACPGCTVPGCGKPHHLLQLLHEDWYCHG